VFVGGLSMGGLLTLYLAERHSLDGIIPMSAAVSVSTPLVHLVPLAKHFLPEMPKSLMNMPACADENAARSLWGYRSWPLSSMHEVQKLTRYVRRSLDKVRAPALVVQGLRDRQVPPAAGRWLYEQLGSTDKELLQMPEAGHCVTVDRGSAAMWERTYRFVTQHVGETIAEPAPADA
jgi:carboxylesterase